MTIDTMHDSPDAPAPLAPSRLWYWSVRRELWENRSLYLAQLAVASVALFGFMISSFRLPARMRSLGALDPDRQRNLVLQPFSMAAAVILMTGLIVCVFYCLDALHGERRDRSILFWKSLPVSDRTAVLSKASIPLLVQPLFGFLIANAAQFLMLVFGTMVLAASGVNPAVMWMRLSLLQMPFVMLYGIAVHALWFAPIYSWLLLISAWAKRAAFLWATLPFFAIFVIERIAFGHSALAELLKYRVVGAMAEAFGPTPKHVPIVRFAQLTPLNFLGSAGLWLGLIFAALCLAAAIRLRRNREPI